MSNIIPFATLYRAKIYAKIADMRKQRKLLKLFLKYVNDPDGEKYIENTHSGIYWKDFRDWLIDHESFGKRKFIEHCPDCGCDNTLYLHYTDIDGYIQQAIDKDFLEIIPHKYIHNSKLKIKTKGFSIVDDKLFFYNQVLAEYPDLVKFILALITSGVIILLAKGIISLFKLI